MYAPEHIARWKLPRDYAGAEWPEYYVAAGRHRDSDCLTESNFYTTLRRLGGESETVRVVRESHWAVGWIEWIAIHESDATALAIADDCAAAIAEYPILDESDFSEREDAAAAELWAVMSWRDRLEYLRGNSHTADYRELAAAVRGDWYAAAGALHCPSDILA